MSKGIPVSLIKKFIYMRKLTSKIVPAIVEMI